MKKALIILGISIGVIVIAILAMVTYINMRGIPNYDTDIPVFEATSSPEIIARGKKLTLTLCAGCHKDPKTGNLTGTQMLDAPKEFGTIFSKNITQHPEHGIGKWTDAELLYLLRTGIKPDGQYIPPYMAKLTVMADEDVNAIIAFLKSDDPLMVADPTPNQESEPSFLTKMLCNFVFKPMPMPKQPIALPDTSDQVALGKYLAQNLECFSCHSADFKTNNFMSPELSQGYFGGGNPTLNKKGQVVRTSNLTFHESGLASWSEEKFVRALRFGLKEGENPLRFPMVPYVHLTEYEAGSIYQYLKTLPPIDNQIERVFYQ